MRRDLFLIERATRVPRATRSSRSSAERLPAHYGVDPVGDIQVFAPVYRGELGIDALNDALRDALNPDGQPVRGGRLRIGDKLMMTGRNLHELGLMNGTLLRLLDEVVGIGRRRRRADPGRRGRRSSGSRPRSPTGCGSRTRARSTAGRGSSCRSR